VGDVHWHTNRPIDRVFFYSMEAAKAMTMMIWWQNTDPPAAYSIQRSIGLDEAEEENNHLMQAH